MSKYIAALLVLFMVAITWSIPVDDYFLNNDNVCGGCNEDCTISAEEFNEVKPQGTCCVGAHCKMTASGRICKFHVCDMFGDEEEDNKYIRWVNNELRKRHLKNQLRKRVANLLSKKDQEKTENMDGME